MASIERTAYPRFRWFMSARELHVFYTPAAEEIAWARENAGSDEHLLGLLVQLKTFSRLGYFPALNKVPAEIAGHIRRDLRLPEAARAVYASTRTAERHRNLIRARSEVIYDPPAARKAAAEAIEAGTPLLDEHGHPRAKVSGTSFASRDWNIAIRDREHPGMFVRRHLEACVFTYLAEQLRTGDIAVAGADSYASWAGQLISPARAAGLLPGFCAGVGLPATAGEFREARQGKLAAQCAATDAGYPDNADLVIDDEGRTSLKTHRAPRPTETSLALEAALRERMPERTLLGLLPAQQHLPGLPGEILEPGAEHRSSRTAGLDRHQGGRDPDPCLAVFGRPATDGERERLARLPEAQIEEWADDGHFVHLVNPERFATRLRTFIEHCDQAN